MRQTDSKPIAKQWQTDSKAMAKQWQSQRRRKKNNDAPLEGEALIKEACRRIRAAKGLWDAHRNAACRGEREKALALYNQLTPAQKRQNSAAVKNMASVPQ